MILLDENIQEIKENLLSFEELTKTLQKDKGIVLRGKSRSVAVGESLLVKVNTSIGISNFRELNTELYKLELLSSIGYHPDTLMDLSTVHTEKPLYSFAIDIFGGPVGTLPHYLCFNHQQGINSTLLMEEIEKQAEAGVAFMTLHLTPRRYLYEKAKVTRLTPITSRGGGIVIKDMYINNREENILSLHFDEILKIFKKHNITLSIGTTFRPSTTVDALDEVQLEEIKIQGEYISTAQSAGVSVIMEGMGHAPLNKIVEYVKLVKNSYGIPVMPLGPITTDAAVGEDHISSAIGASFMAFLGGADIINSVTREEHTGGIPTVESILEGLKSARIAAHSVNIVRFPSLDRIEHLMAESRAKNYTCVIGGGLFTESAKQRFSMGCSRCGNVCPLIFNQKFDID
ncbi:MAG: phosphomethylpyrimidine synthase ThiC [Scytonema sp. PMC 1070.18]|nr:phosphomethylpyrimidine synthase ThiC [Scytonema sp. PMC 1070.18]